ncbi:MAG TPA: hypothetical protein VF761_09875, partial [Gemmatimonadaceae bacterium]
MPPIDPRRVARLEEAVRALHQQVNVLISEVRTLSAQAEAEASAARNAAHSAPAMPVSDAALRSDEPVAPPPPPPVVAP